MKTHRQISEKIVHDLALGVASRAGYEMHIEKIESALTQMQEETIDAICNELLSLKIHSIVLSVLEESARHVRSLKSKGEK